MQRLAAAGGGVDVRLLQVDAQVGVVALHRRQKLGHAGGRRVGQYLSLIHILRIALIQMPVLPDKVKNIQTACGKIREAAKNGADFLSLIHIYTKVTRPR